MYCFEKERKQDRAQNDEIDEKRSSFFGKQVDAGPREKYLYQNVYFLPREMPFRFNGII